MGQNHINTSTSNRKNAFAVNFAIWNERTEKSNKDAKIGSKIQPNTATIALVFNWPATTICKLVSTFPIPVSVYHLLTAICDGRLLLSQVQLLSFIPCAKSVTLSIKPFEDTKDILIYK